jgi:hypothetical protein
LNGSGVIDLVGTTSSISFAQPITFGQMHHSLLIIYSIPFCGYYIQMLFFLESPKIRFFVVSKLWTFIYLSQIKSVLKMLDKYFITFKKDVSNGV